ncbi:MAG: hypothetical protein NTY01_21210 [Verrucomicrobia bacterium]|nr:hypothetical protein [Verrucomicrobiota bacterium]
MKHCLLWAVGCLVSAQLFAASPDKVVFRAGAAASNITPFLGGEIVGNFVRPIATNVHDELHARCLVLDDGKTRLALVVCDVLSISRSVSIEARKLIQQNTGIPPEHVLISAVHTHSACIASGKGTPGEYSKFMAQRIADGVQTALGNLRPAQVAFVTAEAPEHVSNRRWFMKPGTVPPNPFGGVDRVKMNPPGGSPDLVEPAGPTDPTVSVLALRGPDGRPIAVYSAYSLHYVGGTRDGDISADYYGMYCDELKRLLGTRDQDPPFVAMMANGTSGDINSINFRKPRPSLPPYVRMRAIAADIAHKVCAALAKAEYRDGVTLAARFRELTIASRQPTAEQLAWAKETLAKPAPKSNNVDMPATYARRTLSVAAMPKTVLAPLQVFRIGPVCIASMPCEVFCEIGLEFKKRSAVQPAFIVELAHDSLGYLPTPRHFALGGYETWLGTSRMEPQASEKMLAALLEMTAEVKAQPSPAASN